jgi:hypothetical protein
LEEWNVEQEELTLFKEQFPITATTNGGIFGINPYRAILP